MKLLAIPALTLCLTIVGCGEEKAPPPSTNKVDPAVFTASNTATAKVEGMTCEGCAGEVCSAIGKIEGVQAVAADVETGEVKIALKEGATADTEAVKQAITDAGFKFDSLKLPEPAVQTPADTSDAVQ